MNNENFKEQLLELIDSFETKSLLIENLKSFVTSYDGSNNSEFYTFILTLILHLNKSSEFEIKAEAFDKILLSKKVFDEEYSALGSELAEAAEDEITVPTVSEDILDSEE